MLQKKHKSRINFLIRDTAARYSVKLHGYQNVGNHIHLHVQVRSREDWKCFLRVLPQRIMFAVTGARRGKPKGKFWTLLAFSRVVQWGRQYRAMVNYMAKNARQARDILARSGTWYDVPS